MSDKLRTPKKRASLGDEWEAFRKAIIPKVGQVQREEMRKAYYAGASAVFYLLTSLMDEGDEVTQADLAYLDSINAELKAFLDDLRSKFS